MWSTVADWIAKKNTDVLLQDGGFERWVVPTWPTNTGFRKIPWKLVSNWTLIAKRDLFKRLLPATRIVPWLIPKNLKVVGWRSRRSQMTTFFKLHSRSVQVFQCCAETSWCRNDWLQYINTSHNHHIIITYVYMHWHIHINIIVIHIYIYNVNSCCPIFTLTGSWFRILRIL